MSEATPAADVEPFRVSTLGRHSLIYGLGLILTKAVAFVMLPIYTRWLTPADYGVLQLITMTFEVVSIVAGARIAWGIFHHYHKAGGEDERRETLSTALMLIATTYGTAAVGTLIAAEPIARLVFGPGEEYRTLIGLAATSMAFEGLLIVPLAVFRLQDRSKLFVVVNLTRLVLQVVLNLIFLIPFRMGVLGVLWGSVVTHAVVGIALAVHLLASAGTRFRPATARSFLRFGLPLVVMQVATFVVTFGDRYFLNRAADTTEVGLYGLAYQFGFLVVTLGYGPFGQGWDPQRFAIAKRPDRDPIYARVFVYLNLALLSTALGIALFAGDVLRVIAEPAFHPAAAFVPVLALAYVFQGWGEFLNVGIYVSGRTEYYTLANWIAALVAVVGFLYLIPGWLAWGATITTLASMSVRCFLTYRMSQRLWPVRYRWRPVVRLAGLAVVVGLISAVIPTLILPLSVAVHAGLLVIYVGLVYALPILTPEERMAVRHHLMRTLRPRLGMA